MKFLVGLLFVSVSLFFFNTLSMDNFENLFIRGFIAMAMMVLGGYVLYFIIEELIVRHFKKLTEDMAKNKIDWNSATSLLGRSVEFGLVGRAGSVKTHGTIVGVFPPIDRASNATVAIEFNPGSPNISCMTQVSIADVILHDVQ